MKLNDILEHKKTQTEWLVMNCSDLNNVELMAINISKRIKQYTIFVNEEELKEYTVKK